MKISNQIIFTFILLFVVQVNFGQSLEDALGFTETVEDVPEAPINMLIGIALLAGSFLGVKQLKK